MNPVPWSFFGMECFLRESESVLSPRFTVYVCLFPKPIEHNDIASDQSKVYYLGVLISNTTIHDRDFNAMTTSFSVDSSITGLTFTHVAPIHQTRKPR